MLRCLLLTQSGHQSEVPQCPLLTQSGHERLKIAAVQTTAHSGGDALVELSLSWSVNRATVYLISVLA